VGWEYGLLRFWRATTPVRYREVQRNRGLIGSLELHGRRESQKDSKYPRRTLDGETLEPWKGGQGPIKSQLGKGPIKSQLGKGPIESGMFSNESAPFQAIPVKGLS